MSFKSFFTAAALAVCFQAAQAAPHTLVLTQQGTDYSAGLSTQAGSPVVTRTEAGAFRDEFQVSFSGAGLLNAWLETSADLSLWSNQGVTFTRAGFVGIDGSELVLDSFVASGTRFSFGLSDAQVLAKGDFVFFVEGVAGDTSVQQTLEQARLNSFSYSGGINVEPAAAELPEPGSMALAALALVGAVFSTRRRQPR